MKIMSASVVRITWLVLILLLPGEVFAGDPQRMGDVPQEDGSSDVLEQEFADDDSKPAPGVYMVHVSSAGFLSDRMTIAALKSGAASASARMMTEVFSRSTPVTIVVDGGSAALTLATFERAVRDMEGAAPVAHEVTFKGNANQTRKFRELAERAGLNFSEAGL